MNGGYEAKKTLLKGTSQVIGAGVTTEPVSSEFRITAAGARSIRIDVTAASVTAATGITAILQHATFVNPDGTTTWTSTKSAAISGNGTVSIKLLVEDSNDLQYLPLRPNGRVVVTTGAGDAVTITDVRVMQEV